MIEQGKFLELLKEIMEIAKTQDNVVTKEELKKLLGDVELSEQQMESVYAYLAENKITVQGFKYVPPTAEKEDIPKDEQISEEDSMYLKMYKEDLQKVAHLTEEVKEDMFRQLFSGDDYVKPQLLNALLHDVLEVAYKYKNKGVNMEDLIQEGNIGLMYAMEVLPENYEGSGMEYILEKIEAAVVAAVDEMKEDENYEDAIVAKANLIREAAKYLEEDLGRAPSVKELQEYTKIPEDEINDIIHLSK